MTKKKLSFQFKVVGVTKDAAGECVIEGYANTSTKDRVGDVVLPKAFEKSLPTYLANPVLLANHDWNDPCGVVLTAEITDKGLYIKARISDTRSEIKTMIREGVLRTFSIGYNELDADYDESTKTKFIKELELLEISIVAIPANTEAMFTEVSAKTEEKPKDDAEKAAPTATVKTAAELKEFIATVKEVVGDGLDAKSVIAVCDYFNSNGELMTKKELIELLRSKSATLPAAEAKPEAKADDAAPAADKPAGDDAMKQILARLDAMAQALAQVLESLKADQDEDAAEDDKPADDKPAEAPKAEDDASKAALKCEKCGDGNMKPMDDGSGKTKCDKCGHEMAAKSDESEDEKSELSAEEVAKSIEDLTAQIAELEESENL